MNEQPMNTVNEIDLKYILLKLWKGKIYISLFSILSLFFASMYLQNAERLYLVKYKLKPVGETQQKNAFSSLGGFASVAGIQLPSNTTNDFKIFKELIPSVEVSEIIFKNKKLIKKIYSNEWNSSLNTFSEPVKSKSMAYLSKLKKIITGNNEVNYIPPDARRLAKYVSTNISIDENVHTGFLTVRAATPKPDILSSLISEAIDASDQIMRQRYINFSKEPLTFYKEKLRTARSREHREALAELISKEDQKLMFASKGKYFIAEPYIKPTISLNPIAPKPMLILFLSLIFGLFSGTGMILLRSSLKRD
jgi:LPS O-antigen subunit length determinant protein (WzzB/FepE family)